MKKKKVPASGPYGDTIDVILDVERGQSRIARVESGYRFAFELKSAARAMANKALQLTMKVASSSFAPL